MKVAVFGRDGQVATELQRQVPEGIALEILDRSVADFLSPDQIFEVTRALNVDAIINAVAYTQVDLAETDVERATTINTDAVAALARAAAETETPLVHISTDYVFNGSGETPWQPSDPVDPQSVYGQTKLAGEQAITASGARAVSLRTSWVFSAVRANFVKTMLKHGSEKDEMQIVNDQIGGPTPAADIAVACFQIAQALRAGAEGGVYHFSGQDDVSWAGFAREIFDQAGLTTEIEEVPTSAFPRPAPRPNNSRLDCSSLAADFGILRPEWRRGLRDVLDELGY